jgi:hypothetical protein
VDEKLFNRMVRLTGGLGYLQVQYDAWHFGIFCDATYTYIFVRRKIVLKDAGERQVEGQDLLNDAVPRWVEGQDLLQEAAARRVEGQGLLQEDSQTGWGPGFAAGSCCQTGGGPGFASGSRVPDVNKRIEGQDLTSAANASASGASPPLQRAAEKTTGSSRNNRNNTKTNDKQFDEVWNANEVWIKLSCHKLVLHMWVRDSYQM